ncbi:MAG: hypothetical protein HY017_12750 [Betaproteobacteria bacterium]|nr:hypothetical protein [Betaproteobacteria bacterium]
MSAEPLPELSFERIVPGEVYAEREFDVSRAEAAAYASALAEGTGIAPDPAGIPFLMAASWTVPRVSFSDWRVPPGAIHARQTWSGLEAVRPGTRVRVRTTAKETYRAKGRPYVVFESVVEDLEGVPLARGEMTILWPA